MLSHLHALGGGVVGYLVPFLFVLSLVVFFHEFGHFLVARLCGVRVLVFSIGFGPEIVGFNDRHNTRWKISAIPLGGYVKFFGDENASSVPDGPRLEAMDADDRARSFFFQPVFKRAAIVVAGPVANFILAIVIFAAIFMLYGKQTMSARVDTVQADSAAAAAGFQPGDLVVAIDGQAIATDFTEMQRMVSESAGDTARRSKWIARARPSLVLKATPALKEVKDNFGNVHRIGILGISRSMAAEDLKFQPVSPPRAVLMGVQETWFVVDRTLSYLGRGRRRPHRSADQLGGPIGIANVIGKVSCHKRCSSHPYIAAVQFRSQSAFSISFRIPLLDGGHLLFYSIEATRGRPLSERAQELGFRIGFAIVIMLMIFATFNDIVHLTTS